MTSLGSMNSARFSCLDTKKSQEVVDKARADQQLKIQQAAQEFLESVLGHPLPHGDLHQSLRDGVLLCEMLNKLKPDAIPQVSTKKMPFFQMQNISHFLEACSKLGLQKFDLFETVDLYEKKNMPRVIFTILSIERIIAGVPLSRRTQSFNEHVNPIGQLSPSSPSPLSNSIKNVEGKFDEKLQNSPPDESFESFDSSTNSDSGYVSYPSQAAQAHITIRKKKNCYQVIENQDLEEVSFVSVFNRRKSNSPFTRTRCLSETLQNTSISTVVASEEDSSTEVLHSHYTMSNLNNDSEPKTPDIISSARSRRTHLSNTFEEQSPRRYSDRISPTKAIRSRCLSDNFDESSVHELTQRVAHNRTIRSRCLSESKYDDYNSRAYIPNVVRHSDSVRGGRTATVRDRLEVYSEISHVISQYQMGNRIGKGQFGTVYKALNLENGQIVAVKRMKIIDHKEYIDSLMNEVELLKSLSHPQIVKYEGSIRTDDSLYIVIEYVENGSLLKTLKDFGGRFPEKLVKKYALKILEGLMYLHDQKVVHCDLKAANILSTKNGNIKLSDFGVSLNLKLLESNLTNVSANPTVAGTPNWMAPEIIELQGASTASDIWSLGCTIVELLTGKPPYYDLMPLTALFRIVEDDCPPLPENISDKMRSFLLQCFQKDPSMRPTARELYRHDWLVEHRVVHELRKNGSIRSLEKIAVQVEGSPFSRSSLPPNRIDSLISHDRTRSDTDAVRHPPRTHRFVKCSFNKAVVECRICQVYVKKRAFFCDECGLVCHVECASSSASACEPRTPHNTPMNSVGSATSRRVNGAGYIRQNSQSPGRIQDGSVYEQSSNASVTGSNYLDGRFSRFRARKLKKSSRPPQDCCIS